MGVVMGVPKGERERRKVTFLNQNMGQRVTYWKTDSLID